MEKIKDFAQMKIDAPKSHGKVFEVDNGVVAVWPEVETVLNDYAAYFLNKEKMDD